MGLRGDWCASGNGKPFGKFRFNCSGQLGCVVRGNYGEDKRQWAARVGAGGEKGPADWLVGLQGTVHALSIITMAASL